MHSPVIGMPIAPADRMRSAKHSLGSVWTILAPTLASGCAIESQGLLTVEDHSCDGLTCSGRGSCYQNWFGPACVCDDGYVAQGLECVNSDDPCEGVDCSGHGLCKAASQGIAECRCDEGYRAIGLRCTIGEENAVANDELSSNNSSDACDAASSSGNDACVEPDGGSGDPPDGRPPENSELVLEPRIPVPSGRCPEFVTGTINVIGKPVEIWVGEPREDVKGMVFFYWHGTGSRPKEAESRLGPILDEIVASGGIVASFTGSATPIPLPGATGNGVWFVTDFLIADHVLACAVDQLNIDTRRIYTGGCSAGGLQSSAMVFLRSSYLAAAMPNSGGIAEVLVATGMLSLEWEDPSHVPSTISTHGARGVDVVGIADFAATSEAMNKRVLSQGGFSVNCDHGGGHCDAPDDVLESQWRFLKDHPFGTNPSPYAMALPQGFSESCEIFQ